MAKVGGKKSCSALGGQILSLHKKKTKPSSKKVHEEAKARRKNKIEKSTPERSVEERQSGQKPKRKGTRVEGSSSAKNIQVSPKVKKLKMQEGRKKEGVPKEGGKKSRVGS